jgi:AsmA protein
MKKFIKYGVVSAVIFLFLLIATVMVLPIVIDVQKYIPEIEKKLSDVTGRPTTIGSNLGLSFFPSLNISFSDLKIDNPDGYLSDYLMKIESFEARIKLLPLLKKEVEISRFIIGGLEVNLEKRFDGKVNWDFSQEHSSAKSVTAADILPAGWSVPEWLSIGLFAVTDGTVIWADSTQHSEHKIDDLMLLLNNFTLNDRAVVEFKASIDGKSLIAEGEMGPFGQNPGYGTLPVDLAVSFLDTFTGQLKGNFINLMENPGYDLEIHLPPFSVKKLFASLELNFPVAVNNPANFQSVAIDITARGDQKKVSIEKGKIKIDDTLADISLEVNDFKSPLLEFALDIDRLDLDRYLVTQVAQVTQLENSNGQNNPIPGGRSAGDYSAWRKIKPVGTIQLKELKVAGGTVNDIKVNLRGADGIFGIDSSSFVLYQGQAQTTLTLDFQKDIPQTIIDLKAQGVQVKPFLHDFWEKDFLSGTIDTDVRLQFSGYSADAIKASLYADGTLICKDGALEGIDLLNAAGNTEDGPSGSDSSSQKIRTEFSELKSVFTVKNGLVDSRETMLQSPSAGAMISGSADLAGEQWNLMIAPNDFAVKIKEQGKEADDSETSEATSPFALFGHFTDREIRIDTQNLSLKELNLPEEVDKQSFVNEKLPSPVDEVGKDSSGSTLIDPAVVAPNPGIQPVSIRKSRIKNHYRIGSGRVLIRPLQEEEARF